MCIYTEILVARTVAIISRHGAARNVCVRYEPSKLETPHDRRAKGSKASKPYAAGLSCQLYQQLSVEYQPAPHRHPEGTKVDLRGQHESL